MNRTSPIFAGFGLAIVLFASGLAGCRGDSGKELAKVPEGKLTPPGTTLIAEHAFKETLVPAEYEREYRSTLSPDEVNAFYDRTLKERGWARIYPGAGDTTSSQKHMAWAGGDYQITLTQDEADPPSGSHFVVQVKRRP